MSMINDALRRASSSAKAPAAPPPPGLPPMPVAPPPPPPSASAPPPPPTPAPVEEPIAAAPPPPLPPMAGAPPPPPRLRVEPTRKKSVLPLILIFALLFCAAGGAGIYFWIKNHPFAVARQNADQKDEEPTENDAIAALFGDESARAKIASSIDRTNDVPPVRVQPASVVPIAAPPRTAPAPVAATPTPVPAVVSAATPPAHVKFPPLRLQSIFYRPSNPSVIINGKTLFITDEINGVTVAAIQPSSVTLVLSGYTNVLTLR